MLFNLCLRHDISHKIKQLNETLDKILKERVMLGINLNRQRGVDDRPRTTSFVDESDIIGRDKYKDDLVSNLLGKGSQEERNPKHESINKVTEFQNLLREIHDLI